MNRAAPRWPWTLEISKTSLTNQAQVQVVSILVIHTTNVEGGKQEANPTKASLFSAADPQETRTVEFTKGPSDTLGISIAGGVGSPLGDIPIFIAMMNPVGLAAQTQKLKVKELAKVNSSHLGPRNPVGGSGVCSPEQCDDNSASVQLGIDNECSQYQQYISHCGIYIIDDADGAIWHEQGWHIFMQHNYISQSMCAQRYFCIRL